MTHPTPKGRQDRQAPISGSDRELEIIQANIEQLTEHQLAGIVHDPKKLADLFQVPQSRRLIRWEVK